MMMVGEDSNSCWSSSQFERVRGLVLRLQAEQTSADLLSFKNELDFCLFLYSSTCWKKAMGKKARHCERWSSFHTKEDGIISVQLSTKKVCGDFISTSASTEILLTLLKNKEDWVENEGLLQEYQKFLRDSNSFDRADLSRSLSRECLRALLDNVTTIELEGKMERDVACLFLDTKLLEELQVRTVQGRSNNPEKAPRIIEDVEKKVGSVFLAFLQLVLNNRDTVATARALLTDSHGAFTALRKVADAVQLSLCQTVVSFVVRQNLGGSQTGDLRYKDLLEYRPVFVTFVDTLHGLQSILEEHSADRLVCFGRLIRLLRKKLLAYSGTSCFQSAVTRMAEYLLDSAVVSDSNLKIAEGKAAIQSPQQGASGGGSMAGRSAMKLIQRVIQREASGIYFQAPEDVSEAPDSPPSSLSSPSNSTLKFPSLLEFFNTPVASLNQVESPVERESVQDVPDRTPLATQNRNKPPLLRLASFLNDDSPYEVIKKDSTPPSLDDRKADKRKNKENIPPGSQEPKDGHPQSTPKRISKSTKTKRISLTEAEDISSVKNATKKKKPQALPTHKNKLPRNKAPKSLPKNQTKMTAFFARV